LRLGDRLGGHVVQGHVDGVGKLESIHKQGEWLLYRFAAPRTLAPYLVEKGSIAVDGVSLTVFSCRGPRFTVALIPHTLAVTTLGARKPGDHVNLEADVLLKHIAALVRARRPRERRRSLQTSRPIGKVERRYEQTRDRGR
jgi:riboflavin synthase